MSSTTGGSDWTNGLPPFLTVKEAAIYLRVNVKTIYNAITSGALRHVKFGRTIRIPREALADPNGTPPPTPQRKKRGRRDS